MGIRDTWKLSNTVLIKVPTQERIAAASANGWEFRHVLDGPLKEADTAKWYVAWNNEEPISSAPWTSYWITISRRRLSSLMPSTQSLASILSSSEPNRTFARMAAKQPRNPTREEMGAMRQLETQGIHLNKSTLTTWPTVHGTDGRIDPGWYLGDRFTELKTARTRVGALGSGEDRIRIGHLDNGFDRLHKGAPRHLVPVDYHGNAVDLLDYAQKKSRVATNPGEGA
jgi:hypothetical protein